jgi:hypothetical protein
MAGAWLDDGPDACPPPAEPVRQRRPLGQRHRPSGGLPEAAPAQEPSPEQQSDKSHRQAPGRRASRAQLLALPPQGGRLHGRQAQLPTGAAGSRSTALLAVPPPRRDHPEPGVAHPHQQQARQPVGEDRCQRAASSAPCIGRRAGARWGRAAHARAACPRAVPQDLDPLSTLPKLKYLSLVDNPVTKQRGYRCAHAAPPAAQVPGASLHTAGRPHPCPRPRPRSPPCRLYVIARCPKVKVLDFKKVKETVSSHTLTPYAGAVGADSGVPGAGAG